MTSPAKSYENSFIGFDLDGVLRKDGNSPIDKSRKEFLEELKCDYGFDISILSGWSLLSLNKVSEESGIMGYLSFLVGENGGAIQNMESPENVIAYGKKEELDLIRKLIENDEFIWPQISSEDIGKYSIYSINFNSPDTDLKKIKEISQKIINDKKINYQVFKVSSGIDIVPVGIDKGYAIDYIRNLNGYNCVLTVGDGENDIAMLRKSDFGFFVKNGEVPQEVDNLENVLIISDVEEILNHI